MSERPAARELEAAPRACATHGLEVGGELPLHGLVAFRKVGHHHADPGLGFPQ